MNRWKFVHAADLHLDAPLLGLERYEGAPVDDIRRASRGALHNVVDVCIAEQATFLIIAGDVFDGSWRDFNTGLFFNKQMMRLEAKGIRVFLIRGNHDAFSKITLNLRLPDNVIEFGARKPETERLDELKVAVHGRSYATQAVTDNMASGYPEAVPGYLNVGVLHTDLGPEKTSNYAPCSLDDLRSKNYDYWALGHMHRFEVLSREPWIVMAGITQARHAREDGEKGALIVTVEDGEIVGAPEHRPVDVVRWIVVDLDASNAESPHDIVDRFVAELQREAEHVGDRTIAVRVRITGATRAHAALVREPERWKNELRAATQAMRMEVWVEKVRFLTRTPLDLDVLADQQDAVGGLVRSFRALDAGGDSLARLRLDLEDLEHKLPETLRTMDDGFDLANSDTLRALLDQAQQLLLSRLVPGDEP